MRRLHMAISGGVGQTGPILAGLVLYHLLMTGSPFCEAVIPNTSTKTGSMATNSTSAPVTIPSASSNGTDQPGNHSTIRPSNSTTPSVASGKLSTGEIIGIVVGIVCGGTFIIILIICLRRNKGYKKAASAPVTYRRGGKSRHDRAPLTTKDKDPSPLPDGSDDHFYYDDERVRRLDPSALLASAKRPTTLSAPVQRADADQDQASLDGDNASAKDGGDDDYFFDEVYGQSEFTDEKTNTAIKELSSPADEDLPDLMFKDEDFDFDDDDPFS